MSKKVKLFSVKGFQWEEKNKELNEKKVTKHHIRKLVVLGNHLGWVAAKNLRNKYSAIQASIFPDIPEPELKVVKLS